jgi:hypothetical protein
VGVRCGAVCPRAGSAGFVWLGVFGAASRAAVLLSIEPVVASGEWSSPVDQDHPGDLWPGSRASVFFGVTLAAGPGVVVAAFSRAAAFWPRPGLNLPLQLKTGGRECKRARKRIALFIKPKAGLLAYRIVGTCGTIRSCRAPRVLVGLLSGKLEFSTVGAESCCGRITRVNRRPGR